MKIARVTSPYPHGTVASFLGMGEIATKEVFEWTCQNPMPKVVKAASTILRLMNDMGGHEVCTPTLNYFQFVFSFWTGVEGFDAWLVYMVQLLVL